MATLEFQCRHRYPSGFELDLAFAIDHHFTALFGPSGSGKTSVLSIIAGTLQPQSGKVRIGNRTILNSETGECVSLAKRNIGVVFQDALLFPHLSVERNLCYGRRHRRHVCRQVDLDRVVDVLELGPHLQRHPQHLSGGERQRVALGRALLSEPAFLMMDEPLASLDDPLKDRILTYLERAIAEWRIPTLFVTHNQAEVRRAADWVVVVEKGRMIGAGTPDDALALPGPLTWTNASGPVNLFYVESLDACDDHLIARIPGGQSLFLPRPAHVPTQPCFVQFRPSDVVLSIQDMAGLSVRNHLRGRVCQMLRIENTVFVAVDVGQICWAEITSAAAMELNLTSGKEVFCLLKAHCMTTEPLCIPQEHTYTDAD
jgi:molybdate transport system ATP-binding protein